MQLIHVAAAELNQTPLDWYGNKQRILDVIDAARETGATLLCLPELCISGYGCEDEFHSRGLHRMALKVLSELAPATKGMIVSFGLPLSHGKAVFNSACLVVDGKIQGFVAKQFLASDGLHYEHRWFKPWPNSVVDQIEWNGERYPVGDIVFDVGGIKLGFEICEDAWAAGRPGQNLALRGVDLILNPSASHFAFGKQAIRRRFVLEGSRAFGVGYIYANLLGNESGRTIYDGGALIASDGKLVAQGPRFSFADWRLTEGIIDIDLNRMNQSRLGSVRQKLEATGVFPIPFDWPEADYRHETKQPPAWEQGRCVKEEEFMRAITLGLLDYLRKSRSEGFMVSLSGGADSAAVACLVALMVRRAVAELGVDRFKRKLDYIRKIQSADSEEALIENLLTCVYQATRHSSETTRNAARNVAETLGARYHLFEVEKLVRDYTAIVEKALGRELTWERDDIALQNIQARVRSPGIWMLANIERHLLLATSNRSEAAVGYATMDGDTSGGLCPIAGIDKAFLRHWLRWLQSDGPQGMGAIPELDVVTSQAPTAELRPQEKGGQTDEDDLMPYPILDAIERAAIRDKRVPREVYEVIAAEFTNYDAMRLLQWIELFFNLWCRNQWKRERYAPSFHVDDENLDPKTWCRFPILSGGFERELAELREEIEARVDEKTIAETR